MSDRIGHMDHISLAVPDVTKQVDFFADVMGMTVHRRSDQFGLVSDPQSGFRIELSKADGAETSPAHGLSGRRRRSCLHALLSLEYPRPRAHRRERANIRTAFVKDAAGLEIQLSKPDSA